MIDLESFRKTVTTALETIDNVKAETKKEFDIELDNLAKVFAEKVAPEWEALREAYILARFEGARPDLYSILFNPNRGYDKAICADIERIVVGDSGRIYLQIPGMMITTPDTKNFVREFKYISKSAQNAIKNLILHWDEYAAICEANLLRDTKEHLLKEAEKANAAYEAAKLSREKAESTH